VLLPLPFSLYITMFVMEVPLPVLTLWPLGNKAFAVGGDGRRCSGHWLNMYRSVHHGLLEVIPWCGRDLEGVWEVWEMELRAELEWDELVYHHYWVKVWPIIELGNHEGVDEWIDGGVHGGGGHGLI
jgi:hypothetical protein